MKKIKILLLLLLLIPLNVKAASLELLCPTTTSPNTTIDCQIKIQDPLKGIKLNISLPNEITTNKIENNWTSYYKGSKGLVITNNNTGENIAKLSLKISEQATVGAEYQIGLINIEASDNEHKLINIENVYAKIKILSNDNTLSNLTITNGSLSPKFDKNTTNYKATINTSKTTITATPTHNTSKIEGNIGDINLNYGINNLTITVTSEIGTTKTYSIAITRPFPTVVNPSKDTTNNSNNSTSTKSNNYNKKKNKTTKQDTSKIVIPKSSDASLKELKVKGYNIDFNPNTFNYKLKVPNKITTLDITAIPNNNKSKVEISKPDILEVGKNTITITVTSEDGTICKYLIAVTREKKKTTKKEIPTTGTETIKSNKEVPIFPSIPIAILILIILLILLILFITIKRIFNKEN